MSVVGHPQAVIIIVLSISFLSCYAQVLLKTKTDAETQRQAVLGLIRRLVPNRAGDFDVVINSTLGPEYRTTFKLTTLTVDGDRVTLRIEGSSGVAAAWGFHHYVRRWCQCHVSWDGNQLNLPERLPELARGVVITSNDQFRYYANVCTFSYSFVWWNWTQWERHIDWMAMNSINLPLAFTGQETIWRLVYLRLGFTQSDLDTHFAGPAFLAWSRMGNFRSWGGPLPVSWYEQQLMLQKQIVRRMREFGMITVLPGFAGHVPEGILRVFPGAMVSRLGTWSNFNKTYSATLLLDSRVPLFKTIGNMFISEMKEQFGTDHVYNSDPFNEMIPPSNDPEYLRTFAQNLYESMTVADESAIWLLQGWMFTFSDTFWQPEQVRAFLTAIPRGKMLVLDLNSDMHPLFQKYDSYYGQPFIWCMLLNFGGALGNYGNIEGVNTGPILARNMTNSSMVGLGLTMEGIFQNYVMYDFVLEQSWRNYTVNTTQWFVDYPRRRYGVSTRKLETMWATASQSVYNCTQMLKDHGQFIIVKRPSLHAKPFIWYPPRSVLKMWRKAIEGAAIAASSDLYRYDLVDITRQALCVSAIKIYQNVVNAYHSKNLTKLNETGDVLLQLFDDLDNILGSDRRFLLGRWLEAAKSMSENETEKELYEFNARNQITLWGPDGQILDYGKKQWSGLVSDYYRPRWRLFLQYLKNAVETGQKYDHNKFRADVLATVERPFSYARKIYPTEPSGDPVVISRLLLPLYQKYLGSHKIPTFIGKMARRMPRPGHGEKRKYSGRGRGRGRILPNFEHSNMPRVSNVKL